MKMYVWVDPYEVLYGSSLVIAVADSLEEARKEASKVNRAYYAFPLGKPTRVLSLPCAEWHEWCE